MIPKDKLPIIAAVSLLAMAIGFGLFSALDLSSHEDYGEVNLIAGSEPYGENYDGSMYIEGIGDISTDAAGASLESDCYDDTYCNHNDLEEDVTIYIGSDSYTFGAGDSNEFQSQGIKAEAHLENWYERWTSSGVDTRFRSSVEWVDFEIDLDKEYISERINVKIDNIEVYSEEGEELIEYDIVLTNNWNSGIAGGFQTVYADKLVEHGDITLDSGETKTFTVKEDVNDYDQEKSTGTNTEHKVSWGFSDFNIPKEYLSGNPDINDDLTEDNYDWDSNNWYRGTLQGEDSSQTSIKSSIKVPIYTIEGDECVVEEMNSDQAGDDHHYHSRAECEHNLEEKQSGSEDSSTDDSSAGLIDTVLQLIIFWR